MIEAAIEQPIDSSPLSLDWNQSRDGALVGRLELVAGHLYSLWDMLRLDVARLVNLVTNMRALIAPEYPPDTPLTDEAQELFKQAVTEFRDGCREDGLDSPADHAERILRYLAPVESPITGVIIPGVTIQRMLPELENRLLDQLKRTMVFRLDSDKARYFQLSEPFGPEVSKRFPTAIEDIAEAPKCYATDHPTACAFHLMRVIEVGIEAIREALGMQPGTTLAWFDAIEDIRKEAERKSRGKPPEWKQYYARVTTQLHSIRIAWRNDTMHPKKTYTDAEALEVFGHTETLMRNLATSLNAYRADRP